MLMRIFHAVSQTLPEFFLSLLTVLAILLLSFTAYFTFRLNRRKSVSINVVGNIAEAIDGLFPGADGYVLFQNKYWRARTDAPIHPKSRVRIIQSDGHLLHVKALEETDDNVRHRPSQNKKEGNT